MIRLLSIILIVFIGSNTVHAQDEESKIIYSGLDKATSIYATQDHLFVVESGKHRMLKLDHDGNLIETLGGLGSGDYQFDSPIDVDATNGLKIYVSDYGNNRIQIFDRRFQYLGSITGESAFQNRRIRPTRVVVNEFGELFMYDESTKSIFKFDENGSFSNNFEINETSPARIDIRKNDILVIHCCNRYAISQYSQNGILIETYTYPPQPEFIESISFEESELAKFYLFTDRIEKRKND